MGNCLFTKVKGSANNPNLPILETMQQYTIDAIAASGNNSLTDAQKWALNDLFLALGVDGSKQVLSKIRKLYLPMIADDVSKALINYATDSFVEDDTPNSANWELRNHGITQKASGQSFTLTLDNPLLATNFTQMWLRTENMVSGVDDMCINLIVRGKTDKNQRVGLVESSVNSNQNIQMSTFGFDNFCYSYDKSEEQRCVAGISYRAANDISRQLFENYDLVTDGSVTATADMSSETSQTLYLLGQANQIAPKPFGFILLGEAIPDADFRNIRDAVNALYAAIKA